MTFAHSQKGMSVLGWIVTLAVAGIFISAGLKMFPHYMDYSAISRTIKAIETDKAADVRTVPEVYGYVGKSMQLNAINNLDPKDAMEVKLENGEFRIHLKYERREQLIQNLDLVVRFDKEFRVRMP